MDGTEMPLPGDQRLEKVRSGNKDEFDPVAAANKLLTDPKEDMKRVVAGEDAENSGPGSLVREAQEMLTSEASREVESFLNSLLAKRSLGLSEWQEAVDYTAESISWPPEEVERGIEYLIDALKEYQNYRHLAPVEGEVVVVGNRIEDVHRDPVPADTFVNFAKQYLSARFSPATAEHLFPLVSFYAAQADAKILEKYDGMRKDKPGDVGGE